MQIARHSPGFRAQGGWAGPGVHISNASPVMPLLPAHRPSPKQHSPRPAPAPPSCFVSCLGYSAVLGGNCCSRANGLAILLLRHKPDHAFLTPAPHPPVVAPGGAGAGPAPLARPRRDLPSPAHHGFIFLQPLTTLRRLWELSLSTGTETSLDGDLAATFTGSPSVSSSLWPAPSGTDRRPGFRQCGSEERSSDRWGPLASHKQSRVPGRLHTEAATVPRMPVFA